MLLSELSNCLRKALFLPLAFLIPTLSLLASFSVHADAEWRDNGNACEGYWSESDCWISGNGSTPPFQGGPRPPGGFGASDLNLSFSDDVGFTRITDDWKVAGIQINNSRPFDDGFVNELRFLADPRQFSSNQNPELTLFRGIQLIDQPDFVYFTMPIIVGSSAVEIVTESSSTGAGYMLFDGSVNTNGNLLRLRSNGAEIIMNGPITGNGRVTINGTSTGRVSFTGSHSYSGPTTVNNGNLYIDVGGRLPNRSDLVVNSAGAFIMSSDVADAINGLYGSGNVGISGGNTLVVGNYGLNDAVGDGNFSGRLFGDGNFFKRGASGTQSLNGVIDLGGEILVEEGTLIIGSSATLQQQTSVEVRSEGTLQMLNSADYGRLIVEGTANLSGDTTFSSMRIANLNSTTNASLTQNGGSIETAQAIFGFNGQGEFIQNSGDNDFTSLQLALEPGSEAYYQLNSGTVQTDNGIIGYFGDSTFDHFGGDFLVNDTLSLAEAAGSVAQYSLEAGTLTTDVTGLASPPDDPDDERGNATFVNGGGTHTTQWLELGNGGGTGVDDSGEGYYEITSGVTNADRINIWSTGILFINGGVVNARVIDNRSTGQLDFSAGTLSSEKIFGSLRNAGGILSPGNSPGLLTISGAFTQDSNGSLLIELGGNTPESEYDVVEVDAMASLDGTLDVVLYNGFVPDAGDNFDILTASTITGEFSIINLPTVQGILWELQTLVDEIGSTDVLRLSALAQPIPLPASVWLLFSALGLVIARKKTAS